VLTACIETMDDDRASAPVARLDAEHGAGVQADAEHGELEPELCEGLTVGLPMATR
jgi:hypothetical protein